MGWVYLGLLVLWAVVLASTAFRRRRARANAARADHVVIVRFAFEGTDLQHVFELEDRLRTAIDDAGAGRFDGNEVGNGECLLYMYGRDADALFRSVEPVLRASPLTGKARVTRLYG